MDREERLAELLGDWYERGARGDPVDAEALAREHPDLADEIRARVAALELVERALASAGTAPAQIGPYRILEEIGAGGMGTVYLAEAERGGRNIAPGSRVALKVIHPHLLERDGFFKRFQREAAAGRAVRHPNVVRTLDSDMVVTDGAACCFLALEYVEGQTLGEGLRAHGAMPEGLLREVAKQVAAGLSAIHEAGIVHRDLKPENVLITADHVVRIMDLGVSRAPDESLALTKEGTFVGSIHYAAPEQFRRGAEVDQRADLHALGLLLYELSSGQHPYYDEDYHVVLRRVLEETPQRLGELNPQLSPFFEEVVHRLLEKDRDARFGSAAELAAVLGEGERSAWWHERARTVRAETKRPLRPIRIPRETAVYGRDDDLVRLHALYEKAKAGDGQVALLEGEAGIGKTRLVDEFVARLQESGEPISFLFGSYPPGGAATAAGAFSTAYREHFGAEGLEETLGEYLTVTPLLIPAFAALLRGEPGPEGREALTKDSLQTCFVGATRALAAERTTVVLIDDLHFAPEEGRALFAALALAVPGHRVLLLGTARPGVPEDWTASLERLEHASRRVLTRLGPKDLARLLRDVFRSERLAEELSLKIGEKSDGNPFFVFEIIRGLKEGQFIRQRPDGTWETTRILREIQVPSSITDLIEARIADLDREDKNLLDVAACCGYEFDAGLVGDALGRAAIPTLQRLARIEKKHRLVRSAGERFVFDHHQVQEALAGGLPPPLARAYHGAIADALETRENAAETEPGDLGGALSVDLCEHFLAGAGPERALRYLDAALNHLEAGYLNDQAVALADRALVVPDLVTGEERAELLLRKAARLDLLVRVDAERAALDEALALAETDGGLVLRARVETSLGDHLVRVARFDDALEVLSRALERAREAGDKKIVAQATGSLGSIFLDQGRYEEAREHFERHLALACEIGDRRGEATAAGRLGIVVLFQGRYEEAHEHYERHLALAREIGDRVEEARGSGKLGNVFWSQGRHEEAREHYERLRTLARELGDRRWEAAATGSLGNVFAAQGRFEAARAHDGRCLALAREMGDRQTEAVALVNLGPIFVELGRADIGRERLRESLAICRRIGARRVEGHALERLGAAAERLGEAEAAERLYGEALALRREIGDAGGIATTLATLGALLATTGRREEAVALLNEAAETAREVGVAGALVLSRCRLALLPDGDAEAARAAFDEFEQRLQVLDRMQSRFLLWKATGGAADLAEAHRLLQFQRDHAPEEYRDTMLTNVPLHRDIAAAHGGANAGN